LGRSLFKYHSVIGYTFIPNLKARVNHEGGGYLIQTNSDGFRCKHEFIKKKKKNTYRILFFGDSFTAGDGVSNEFRFSDLLESDLKNTEILNFGLSGTGVDQQYLIFRDFASDLDYDLVVISPMLENIRRNVVRFRPHVSHTGRNLFMQKPYYEINNIGELDLNNVPVPKKSITLDQLPQNEKVNLYGNHNRLRLFMNKLGSKQKDIVQKITKHEPLTSYDSSDNPDWVLMKAIIEKWISNIKTKIIICPLPIYHYVEELNSPNGYIERFYELHKPPEVIFHNILPTLLKYSTNEKRLFRFKNDAHPTKVGHKAYAKSLSRLIETLV
tara:strand:- start:386 stop:1366 length:981 start_codon:yes stop_codon:yes gene_type:complete